jgi:hypothetical protein
MINLDEHIIEKWVEDKLVQLTFIHKINTIYQDDVNKKVIIVETRDGRSMDFTFEDEKSALNGLKLFRDKLLKNKRRNNGKTRKTTKK